MSEAADDEYMLLDSVLTQLTQLAEDESSLRKEFYSMPDDGNDAGESQTDAYSTSDGQKAENKRKNRYKDIVPYDTTRVKLSESFGVDSDYINANYVKGPTGKRTYIACQGPLKHTVVDMWRMIWECGVHVVIMACNEKEGQKVKCERYWPSSVDETININDLFLIRLVSERSDPQDEYIVRRMRVTLLCDYVDAAQLAELDLSSPSVGDSSVSSVSESGRPEREVTQYHYVGWPDYGIPSNCTQLIQLLAELRSHSPSIDSPIAVHCSAGCGRTGTVMCVDYVSSLIRLKLLTADLNVKDIVMEMRRQRPAVVQSYDQYVMCIRSVIELLSRRLAELTGTGNGSSEVGGACTSSASLRGVNGNDDTHCENLGVRTRTQSQVHVISKPSVVEHELRTARAYTESDLSAASTLAVASDDGGTSKLLDASPTSPFVPVVPPSKTKRNPSGTSLLSSPPPAGAASNPNGSRAPTPTLASGAEPGDTSHTTRSSEADRNNNQAEWSGANSNSTADAVATMKRSASTAGSNKNKMPSLFGFRRKPPATKSLLTSKSASFESESMMQVPAKRDGDAGLLQPLADTEEACARDESRATRMYQFVFRGIDIGFRKLVGAHPQGTRDPPWPPT